MAAVKSEVGIELKQIFWFTGSIIGGANKSTCGKKRYFGIISWDYITALLMFTPYSIAVVFYLTPVLSASQDKDCQLPCRVLIWSAETTDRMVFNGI